MNIITFQAGIMPDFGGMLSTIGLLLSIIISVTLFLVFWFVVMPPIARRMITAKWSKCSPGFIQDDAGVVHFVINDTELPEGVVHNKRGWFLRSRPPFTAIAEEKENEATEENPHKRGPKPKKRKDELTDEEIKALGAVLEAPVLEGLGKSVFFGYDGSPLVANLKTLVHADLRVMKEIIPATISRTQLGNLHRWSLNKGYEKRGGDTTKLIVLAIIAAMVIGSLAIAAYLLLSIGKGA